MTDTANVIDQFNATFLERAAERLVYLIDGDRAVIRWRVTGAEHYRGVNLVRVRDGKIVEALGYGKRPSRAMPNNPGGRPAVET